MRLTRPEQYAEAETVQQSAWGLGASGGVPRHLLVAGQHHSGLVLGAYDGRKMVGVLFGFTALDHGRPYQYSHITGVRKDYQSKNVGFKLKLAQRRHVLQTGQHLVKWTFDPLQAGNAYLNIGKLGAICRTYWRELYGSLNDSLNRERLTDRFEVEWWVNSQRVKDKLQRKTESALSDIRDRTIPLVNQTRETNRGVRIVTATRLNLKAPQLLAEIPESIVKVRDLDLDEANRWTLSFRRIFEHYFRSGYVVTDVKRQKEASKRRVFYLLESHPRIG